MSPAQIHLLFETLAYVLGYQLYRFLKTREQDVLTAKQRFLLFIFAGSGAYVMARLGTWIEPGLGFVGAKGACGTGKTIVGALVGGLLAVEGGKKLLGINISTGDIYTFPLILGIAVGRIGCFGFG